MELTIALLKYTRGELKSCQLPVIAMQAIADGYTSKSLDILAGESGPVEASDVNPLFEKALHELGISLPVQAHQSSKESPWPLSAHSPEFAAMIDEALWKNGELLILQRFAYVAGADAGWYLIKTREQWRELLDSGRAKTAYTLILEPVFSLRGMATAQLQAEAVALFGNLGDLMMAKLPSDDTYISLRFIEWTTRGWNTRDAEKGWQIARSQIVQFFSEHQGSEIGVGRSLDVWDEDIREITAYIPDADGTVRPGAY